MHAFSCQIKTLSLCRQLTVAICVAAHLSRQTDGSPPGKPFKPLRTRSLVSQPRPDQQLVTKSKGMTTSLLFFSLVLLEFSSALSTISFIFLEDLYVLNDKVEISRQENDLNQRVELQSETDDL